MFKTHINNIAGIKAAVAHFGKIWFHGDGNIYHNESDSDFRKDFSNDPNGPQAYRVKFEKGDAIPETLEELNQLLITARTKEMAQLSTPEYVTGVSTFKVELPKAETAPAVEASLVDPNADKGEGATGSDNAGAGKGKGGK